MITYLFRRTTATIAAYVFSVGSAAVSKTSRSIQNDQCAAAGRGRHSRAPRLLNTYIAAVAALSLVAIAGSAAPRPHFHVTGLPTLSGGHQVSPRALNNHGDVVGSASDSNGTSRAFLYRNGFTRELPIGDGRLSTGIANDINDDGHIVAQATVTNFYRGYLITPQGVLDLDAQSGLNIWPVGINQKGVIAANIPRGFASEAITWSNRVVRRLGYLDPTNGSYALGINNRGEVLGNSVVSWLAPAAGIFSVVFHNGGLSVLGTFYAEALNDRGDITGELDTNLHAFHYRAGRLLDLGTLPGDSKSFARAINNSGQIVGYSEGPGERSLAFLYTDGTLYDLNDLISRHSGWVLSGAWAINDRGQIVGFGYYRGQERSFLLTPLKKLDKPARRPKPLNPPRGVFPGP